MKKGLIALACLGLAASPALTTPPLELIEQKAQAGPMGQRIHPSPMDVTVKKGPLTLVIKREGAPGEEPGQFELELSSDAGPLSAVQCKVGDRDAHPVGSSGGKASWQESGDSDTPVTVTATVGSAGSSQAIAVPRGPQTITASLPGGRVRDMLGAGLPGGLQIKQWYDAATPAGVVRVRYTLEGPTEALDRVDAVEYRLPQQHFATGHTQVAQRATGFRLEAGSAQRDWSTTAVIKFKDGSTSTVSLPFSPR